MPRDIVPVLRAILAVEGLPEGLKDDLEQVIRDTLWFPPEMQGEKWSLVATMFHRWLADAPLKVLDAVRIIWTARQPIRAKVEMVNQEDSTDG